MSENSDFEILSGGNINGAIERYGEAIHRPGLWKPEVHAFLRFLEERKVPGVPRFLGLDEQEREILSYLPGYVPGNSFPQCEDFVWSDENVIAIGRFLRRFHDASEAFLPQAEVMNWASPFAREEWGAICHNDAAPYNFAFEGGVATGLIDFDMTYPAPRLWDIAYTVYTTIPLGTYEPAGSRSTRPYGPSDAETRRYRLGLFFDAYGIPIPEDLYVWVARRLQELCDFIRREAANGNEAFRKMEEEGHAAFYEGEIEFLRANHGDWRI